MQTSHACNSVNLTHILLLLHLKTAAVIIKTDLDVYSMRNMLIVNFLSTH